MGLGQLLHYGFDALLISMILAGIRRTTGYTLKGADTSEKEPKGWLNKYLHYGERSLDITVAFMTAWPNWFEKK